MTIDRILVGYPIGRRARDGAPLRAGCEQADRAFDAPSPWSQTDAESVMDGRVGGGLVRGDVRDGPVPG